MRIRMATILALFGVLTATSCAPSAPSPINPETSGTLAAAPGDDGPCTTVRKDRNNPAEYRHDIAIFEPSGPGECSANDRPLVVLAHGYLSTVPEPYMATIEHFVSRGNVVVFPGYSPDFDPPQQYRTVNTGIDVGVAASGRVDTAKVSVVGHSFGGGMTPYLMQRIVDRGWGNEGLSGTVLSPAWSFELPDGPIRLPDHARVTVITYEEDNFVDMEIASQLIRDLTIPDENKTRLLIHSDYHFSPALVADHLLPLSIPLDLIAGLDHFDRWATWRPADATQSCANEGTFCDLDLADMGTYRGREVKRASSGFDLRDVGPPALAECNSELSPRPCSVG